MRAGEDGFQVAAFKSGCQELTVRTELPNLMLSLMKRPAARKKPSAADLSKSLTKKTKIAIKDSDVLDDVEEDVVEDLEEEAEAAEPEAEKAGQAVRVSYRKEYRKANNSYGVRKILIQGGVEHKEQVLHVTGKKKTKESLSRPVDAAIKKLEKGDSKEAVDEWVRARFPSLE